MSLQQSLELLRPEFISRSRQRARRVRLLREEREHNIEIDRERRQMLLFSCSTCCSNPKNRTVSSASSSRQQISYVIPYDRPNSSRVPLTYRQMKQATKKKYDQLPEVKDRRLQNQMDDIRRRNYLRAKVFRARLRQHVARHGRTNIDESLTMIDT
jgi:alstrom syndrome protein 1